MPGSTLVPRRSGALQRDWLPSPFLSLHREMNRLFDDVLREGFPGASGDRDSFAAPHVNVSETDKEFRVTAELPGVAEKDVDLVLDGDVLTIRGEKRREHTEEKENFHVSERSFGAFERSLRLPFTVAADQVRARFENGVLTVCVPKSQAQPQGHKIPIEAGAAQVSQKSAETGKSGQQAKS